MTGSGARESDPEPALEAGTGGAVVNAGPREVGRGLLFDGRGRLLMVHWRDPVTGHEFLEPPGGLREGGETFEETVRREIVEETGLEDVEVGDLVAEIDHRFTFGGEDYDCRERYFACRLTGAGRRPASLDPVEDRGIVGIEWVALGELAGHPTHRIEPPQLPEMLGALGRAGGDSGR